MAMILTKGEITELYRTAKNKRKQIGILAELNCCSKKEMRAYLREQCGYDVYEPVPPTPEQMEARKEKMRVARAKAIEKKMAEKKEEEKKIEEKIKEAHEKEGVLVQNSIFCKCPVKEIKKRAFQHLTAFSIQGADQKYMDGFLSGVSMVIGLMEVYEHES